ncbi:O-antigen ligase family protein [Sphingomonas sanguinis]|uniref:O-antigen ligase family protein n=1 Tax=Sphingomonas sp. LC-1 TaxID=3110957 RepID=UPI0021BB5FF0|nr:O-antigen ligase family protein [Sphingomonas sp. LC-1]MCT8000328.1 O-antigen ligase family protein [Sphingomonas sp. LC-1]
MTDQALAAPGVTTAEPWRRAESARAAQIAKFVRIYLVLPAAIIAIYRSTQMWYGYPTSQTENASNDPFLMQLVLYSLVPLTGLATVLLPRMAGRAMIRMGPLVALLGIFLIGSIVASDDRMSSLRGFIAMMLIVIPMLYLASCFGVKASFDLVWRVMAVLLVVNFAYSILFPHFAFMSGSLNGTMRGMFSHKNAFGAYCALTFVMLLPPDFDIRRWDRLLRLVLCAVAAVGAKLSLSSTAIVLLIVGTGMVVVTGFLSRIEQRTLRALAFAFALSFVILLASGAGVALLGEVAGSFGKDVTLSGRAEIWEALWPVALDKPWLGHGFAIFRQTSYFQQFTSTIAWGPRSTHNTYLEIALNSGFPALFVWLAIMLAAIFRGILLIDPSSPDYRPIQKGIAAIVMALLVSTSEAGQMLAPLSTWPILVLSLYCIAISDGTRRVRRASSVAPLGEGMSKAAWTSANRRAV